MTKKRLKLPVNIALLFGAFFSRLWRNCRDKGGVIVCRARDGFRLRDGFLFVVFLLMYTACSKDVGTQTGEVEVCVFFAPGELGDNGYADRLLTGLYRFESQLSECDQDRVLLRHISSTDIKEVHNEIIQWENRNTSPYTGKRFERRLMVLTDPVLLPMLEDALLDSTDEVLVMNVSNGLFEQIPRLTELGPRLHLLSISAAEAAAKFCQMVDHSETVAPDVQKQFWLLQQFDDIHAMADSIGVVVYDHVAGKPESPLFTMSKQTYDGTAITLSEAYMYAHFFPFGVSTEDYSCYMMCGWGGLNVALSSLIAAKDLGATQVTFLDTDYVALRGVCHTVIRHYDRAFLEWLQRWFNSPAVTMPAREWHGSWDGYVTDDL